MRLRRPTTKTKRCAHCKRRRPRLKIEWHPGICEWQCSNFSSCDDAIARNETITRARLRAAADKAFWRRTRYKPGKQLNIADPKDRKMVPIWMDIYRQKQREMKGAS